MASDIRRAQHAQTHQILLAKSRALFATKGYAAVGLAEIVRAAGVTKGALYHHFHNKAGLFRAVLEQVHTEVSEQVAATAGTYTDPWEQLRAGCRTFLTYCTAPDIQQIMLIDGPAVLGWHEWRTLDESTSAQQLTEALTTLIETGHIALQPVEPLTHLLSGAMNEAALWLATDPTQMTDTLTALNRILYGLTAHQPTAGTATKNTLTTPQWPE